MDEELKKLKEQLEEANKNIEALKKSVAEKDAVIDQKNNDLAGQRHKYKKLADMTQEEKDALSAKEMELQQRMEEFELKTAEFEQKQTDALKVTFKNTREALIKKMVGADPKLVEKVTKNFESIKGAEEAMTNEEIEMHVKSAYNMLGDERPDPLSVAIENGGGSAPASKNKEGEGFAETKEGQGLASKLSLASAPKPEEAKAPDPKA